ncbi:hypothetical protein [Mycobacterium deserti]|uniref:Uncharacterized protein n=1 Tax=Mycobacterium deserti TaxID=2978347 RepID=A0ABT2MJI4_9MYCO|nr:hypothetical protein [Mycobacterium deserti]MCT7661141.1 hypothetical protein [Mycobacterium deserti]
MNTVLSRIQEQVSRVDRTRSLMIGISAGLTALWSLYRVFWLFYATATFSSVGWSPVSLVFPLVLWGAIAIATGAVSAAFLLRYAKQP